MQRKFLLSRTHQQGDGMNVSEVVMADTFSVQVSSAVCQVTMSNAYVFRTTMPDTILPKTTNAVHQSMLAGTFTMGIPNGTKVIFNDSATDISKFKFERPR